MMDTTEQHTRRLWIDPDAMSELVSGLVDKEDENAVDKDEEAAKWAELSDGLLAVVDDDRGARDQHGAHGADTEPSGGEPTVAPEILQRLDERLARIRDLAARSGAMAHGCVGSSSSVSDAGAGADAAGFPAPRVEECGAVPVEREVGGDAVSADRKDGGSRGQRARSVERALQELPEGILHAADDNPAGSSAALSDQNFARFRDRVASLCKDVAGGPRKQPAASVEDGASLRVRADSNSIEFSSHASPREKFATLSQWLESEIGEERFVLVDEHGMPIDLRGIERQRFDVGGDLAVLLQRARQAIGSTEIGIHLAIDDAEGESLCVVNCPNLDFPICIGIVTQERIPFRKMVAIGNALERTFC